MSTKVVRCAIAVIVLTLLASRASVNAGRLYCYQAVHYVLYCTDYLTGFSDAVIAPCCRSLAELSGLTQTSEERKNVCACVIQMELAIRTKPARAAALPQICNVDVPMKLDIDCTKL